MSSASDSVDLIVKYLGLYYVKNTQGSKNPRIVNQGL